MYMQSFIIIFFTFTTLAIARPSNNSSADVTGGDEPCVEGTNVGEGVENEEQQYTTVKKNAVVLDEDGNLSEVPVETIECE